MRNISFTYSEDEEGWVSELLTFINDVCLHVKLKRRGYLSIKQKVGDTYPTAMLTEASNEMDIKLKNKRLDEEEVYAVRLITSEEPESATYHIIQR